MNSYPRETAEFVPVEVKLDGVVTTTDVQLAVVPNGTRPTVWTAAVLDDGRTGFTMPALVPGTYRVFAKIGAVVEDCGTFQIN